MIMEDRIKHIQRYINLCASGHHPNIYWCMLGIKKKHLSCLFNDCPLRGFLHLPLKHLYWLLSDAGHYTKENTGLIWFLCFCCLFVLPYCQKALFMDHYPIVHGTVQTHLYSYKFLFTGTTIHIGLALYFNCSWQS